MQVKTILIVEIETKDNYGVWTDSEKQEGGNGQFLSTLKGCVSLPNAFVRENDRF